MGAKAKRAAKVQARTVREQQVREHLLDASDERYPEHAKQRKVIEKSQVIGEFLEFGLPEQEIVLATRNKHGELMPCHKSIQRVLADYYEIDLAAIDREKTEMLENIRSVPR